DDLHAHLLLHAVHAADVGERDGGALDFDGRIGRQVADGETFAFGVGSVVARVAPRFVGRMHGAFVRRERRRRGGRRGLGRRFRRSRRGRKVRREFLLQRWIGERRRGGAG